MHCYANGQAFNRLPARRVALSARVAKIPQQAVERGRDRKARVRHATPSAPEAVLLGRVGEENATLIALTAKTREKVGRRRKREIKGVLGDGL